MLTEGRFVVETVPSGTKPCDKEAAKYDARAQN